MTCFAAGESVCGQDPAAYAVRILIAEPDHFSGRLLHCSLMLLRWNLDAATSRTRRSTRNSDSLSNSGASRENRQAALAGLSDLSDDHAKNTPRGERLAALLKPSLQICPRSRRLAKKKLAGWDKARTLPLCRSEGGGWQRSPE